MNDLPYCPAAFIDLVIEPAAQLSHALDGLTGSSKLIVWLRQHGALGGNSVVHSLQTGTLMRGIEEFASAEL